MKHFDVAVIGAGIIGSACALKLTQQGLSVALVDQHELKTEHNILPGARISAFNEASYKFLHEMSVWEKLPFERLTDILAMRIFSDQQSLSFDAAEFGFANLGYILENEVLTLALRESVAGTSAQIFCPYRVGEVKRVQNGWELSLLGREPQNFNTNFLIIAQGGQADLRERLGVNSDIEFYQQKAIVMNLEASLPHRFTAYQRFLPTGPVAFLPLFKPNWYSIVWTLPTELADEYLHLPLTSLLQKLMEAFPEIGNLTALTKPAGFELSALKAQNYVGRGFALIGDSAHTVHPLAGQGVNIGLRDVAVLAEILAQQGNIFTEQVLAEYERRCQLHNQLISHSFGMLNRVFQIKQPLVARLLDFGFKHLDHLHGLKRQLINIARG